MAPPNPTPGFISLQQYLDANQGGVNAMGQTLASAGATQAQTAEDEADQWAAGQRAGGAAAPAAYAKALGDQQRAGQTLKSWDSYGGLYNDAQQQYGKQGTYTPGANTLDALLLGGSPQAKEQFQAVQKQYGGLSNYLQGRDTTRPPPAPGTAGTISKGPVNQTPVNYGPPLGLAARARMGQEVGDLHPAGGPAQPRRQRPYDWRV